MSIHNPTLPDGWTSEAVSEHHTVIRSPDGAVTVDWGRGQAGRGFRGGYSTTGWLLSKDSYRGRGWEQKLIGDAVKWLRDADVSLHAACTCGHAIEEHGNDPEYPGSTACSECSDCIAYEDEDDHV